jgi:amino acid adenylation domain-containing protein
MKIFNEHNARPLLTESGRQPVASEESSLSEAIDQCIHQLFEQQVERTPHAIALRFEEQQLTYAELNARANQLARYLRALGVGPEVLVGIYLERSLDMIVGLLAILKAGGAYLPMEIALPKERLKLFDDAGVCVLLTLEQLKTNLPELKAETVCLDSEWNAITQFATEDLNTAVAMENLVYVLFTSGSTGKPKGVAVEHRQLVNYVHGACERLTLSPGDNYATVSTIAADLGNTTIFPSLCMGGCLHVVSRARVSDPGALADYFGRHPIDCLKIVPSHLAALLKSSQAEKILPRRKLILGGEASRYALVEKVRLLNAGCTIFNHYGPTETTVGALTYETAFPLAGEHNATLPIGRPLPNTRIYVLDDHLQPVEPGTAGELYIGGVSVSRGYLSRPELTAEKFIPDPFGTVPGGRLYRTGDLARQLPDSNIEFIGRIDRQVKIRGFRIELGEIENALARHPQVRDALVVAKEIRAGEITAGYSRLVGYIVPESGKEPPEKSEILTFLRERLPDYMLPSVFVSLSAWPLTPNGKVDRDALPMPGLIEPESEITQTVFHDEDNIELRLAKIWKEVLNVRSCQADDNFFDLGGNSLSAISLFAEIEKDFGISLPMTSILLAPTIRRLAVTISQGQSDAPMSSLVAIQPNGSKLPFYYVHGQGGNIIMHYTLAPHLEPDQPFYGLQSHGLDGKHEPFTRIEEMAAHYIAEILSVQRQGPYLLGGFCSGAIIAFEMARQLHASGRQAGLVAMVDPYTLYRNQYLSPVPKFRSRLYHIVGEVDWHLDAWEELGPRRFMTTRLTNARKKLMKPFWSLGHRVYPRLADERRRVNYKVWQANILAEKNYVPQSYPDRITIFMSSKIYAPHKDTRLSFSEKAAGGAEVHLVPGSHISMTEEPQVRILAQKLTASLRRAQEVARGR